MFSVFPIIGSSLVASKEAPTAAIFPDDNNVGLSNFKILEPIVVIVLTAAFVFCSELDFAIIVRVVDPGAIPKVDVPNNFVGSKDKFDIVLFPCILRAT